MIYVTFGGRSHRLPALVAALLLATPALSVLSAVGAALTLGVRHSGAIIGLLVLPLASPLLIFGARATDLAAYGEPIAGPLYLLAALAVLAISIGPLAVAAAGESEDARRDDRDGDAPAAVLHRLPAGDVAYSRSG